MPAAYCSEKQCKTDAFNSKIKAMGKQTRLETSGLPQRERLSLGNTPGTFNILSDIVFKIGAVSMSGMAFILRDPGSFRLRESRSLNKKLYISSDVI